MKVIYWTHKVKNNPDVEKRIRDRFHLGTYKSVNGETPVIKELSTEEWSLLKEVEHKGYIQIREKL